MFVEKLPVLCAADDGLNHILVNGGNKAKGPAVSRWAFHIFYKANIIRCCPGS